MAAAAAATVRNHPGVANLWRAVGGPGAERAAFPGRKFRCPSTIRKITLELGAKINEESDGGFVCACQKPNFASDEMTGE